MKALRAEGVNGQIEIDDRWLTIRRKGALAVMTQGLKGDKRIPLSSITSVQFKPAGLFFNGYIQFSMLGGVEAKSGIFGATQDENSVMFRVSAADAFDAVREHVESVIAQEASRVASSTSQEGDVADQIRKLAKLRDENILTEDEFQQRKRQLLNL